MIRNKKNLLLLIVMQAVLFSPSVVVAVDQQEVIQTRLKRLERMMDGGGLVDILHQLEGMQKEIRELRGEVEQQAYTLEQMKNSQQNMYNDLDQRVQSPSSTVLELDSEPTIDSGQTDFIEPTIAPVEQVSEAVQQIPVPIQPVVTEMNNEIIIDSSTDSMSSTGIRPVETYTAGETGSSTANNRDLGQVSQIESHPVATDLSEKDEYTTAFNLLKQGQYDQSVIQFETYLQRYPNSQYSDNAQYWLGEAYYVQRQFKPALREYQRLIGRYPDSGKVSHAQLKIAYCYDELGEHALAQGELEDLIARYPGTSAATLANERLALIRTQ